MCRRGCWPTRLLRRGSAPIARSRTRPMLRSVERNQALRADLSGELEGAPGDAFGIEDARQDA